MDKKVTYIKEKEIQKKLSKNSSLDVTKYAQNPIEAKLNAFKNAKKSISFKDLF